MLLDELTENISLDRLAAAAGVSKFRLVRLFRSAFGIPPHAFQIGHRVMAAQRLIERGGRPADVAVRAGFYDESHLARHFSRRVGMTPGTYAVQFRTSVS
jgi:AraC-like DNA-binding protein